MKLRFLLAIILSGITPVMLLGQETTVTPSQIPLSSDDNIIQAELSPDGSHIAVMTMHNQGETAIEVWSTTDTTNRIKLIPDLTMFNGFMWSPNSQYVAATGQRGNASGTEYKLLIYDILDRDFVSGTIFPGRYFGEFVTYEDTGPHPDYFPAWGADSSIIAINFRDGIYFYDITDYCNNDECRLLYILEVGYLPSFDWQGDTLISVTDNAIQLWDIGDKLPDNTSKSQ